MDQNQLFINIRRNQATRVLKRYAVERTNKRRKVHEGQFITLPIALVDNQDFRNGLMAQGRFRTYLFLRRYVMRAFSIGDKVGVFENYWMNGELAVSMTIEKIAERLNLPKSTVSDHIRQLENDGVIVIERVSPEESMDGIEHTVFILGSCINGIEHWYIDEVFAPKAGGGKNSKPRRDKE